MEFKVIVIGMLALILASLGKALFHLSNANPDGARKMVGALTWRIGLSVLLFLLLIVGYYSGWVTPPAAAVIRQAPVQSQ
jgi:TRAP-type C4-dicarboxylate transport system permease large subunit